MGPKNSAVKKAVVDFTNRRAHTRYPAATHMTAFLDPAKNAKKFTPAIAGLVINESAKGCALVIRTTESLQTGDTCVIKLGTLDPFFAEVRWRTQLDAETIKIGVMFLDGENPVRR